MNFKVTVTSIFCSTLIGSIANAQGYGLAGEVNYAEAGEISGLELGIGLHATDGPWRISPIIGALIYQGELDGFRNEPNGVCRDLSNGQFSASENCDATEIDAYGKLEAGYVGEKYEVSIGYRFG